MTSSLQTWHRGFLVSVSADHSIKLFRYMKHELDNMN